jgi:hypothetical protein
MSRLLYQLSYGPAMMASITLRKTWRAVKVAGGSHLSSGVIHETPQHLAAAGMAQFAERLRLNLPHPLARHVEVVTNFFQGMGRIDPDPKALA